MEILAPPDLFKNILRVFFTNDFKESTTVKRNNQISIILNPYDRDVRSVLQKNSSPLLHVILATITAHASRVTNNKINAPLGDVYCMVQIYKFHL